ncbi:MAG TPA: chemotaxis protein CheW [Candidatus Sulfomarinibacteraceae bacterium]|nr:chemotaxis protein CheW [Candidatus Sulfomarinibacteraceae bacterium]
MRGQQQFCTLTVGNLLLGIQVDRVQEVLRDTAITPVPLAHPAIRGLINLRGQIVTAIDLRRRLGLPEAPADASFMTVVLGVGNEALALVVDGVGDVVQVPADSFEAPPDTLRGDARRMIAGAHKLERRLLLVLNLDTAIEPTDGEAEAS